jgi:Hyaluronidase protein (HylP)
MSGRDAHRLTAAVGAALVLAVAQAAPAAAQAANPLAIRWDGTAASATTRLLTVDAGGPFSGALVRDGSRYATAALHVQGSSSTGNVAEVVSRSQGSSSNALSVVSHNRNDTAVGVSGAEAARGTLKVVHRRPDQATDDSAAAALSILLGGAGTRAQGIFVKPDAGVTLDGTTPLIHLRNDGTWTLKAYASGDLSASGSISAHGGDVRAVAGRVYGAEGLAVGNSVALPDATATPRTVTRAMPVFDGAGNRIGYVPVYAELP